MYRLALVAGCEKGIDQLVEEAWKEYEFFQWRRPEEREKKGFPLLRCKGAGYSVEKLVDGKWLLQSRFFQWQTPDEKVWKSLQEGEAGKDALKEHVWRFFTVAPGSFGPRGRSRLGKGVLCRWLFPPLNGGAARNVTDTEIKRARRCYQDKLHSLNEDDLKALKDQVERGLDRERGRCVLVEQRANFFLTAAGLSTSLVLANAGLLLGTKHHLEAPWLQLAAAALGLASLCTIAAGLRAMQATTSPFERHLPNEVKTVLRRSGLTGNNLMRRYVAEVITAIGREEVIADWKLARLTAARTLFLCGIGGVVLLTVFVLVEVL